MTSGKQLEDPKGAIVMVQNENGDESASALPSEHVPPKKSQSEKAKEFKPALLRPYMPPLPFLRRFLKAKLDTQFWKFLDVLKKLHVNVSFIDILPQMPT